MLSLARRAIEAVQAAGFASFAIDMIVVAQGRMHWLDDPGVLAAIIPKGVQGPRAITTDIGQLDPKKPKKLFR